MHSSNLLIFGCDFLPVKKTSEINFWNDMVSRLSAHFHEVIILSVNNREVPREKLGDNVYLYNERPRYWGNTPTWQAPEYTGKRFHKLPLSIIYKSYTFWRLQATFEQIIQKHHIGIIHYMRVFGLFNRMLVDRYPHILFSMTVPTHIDRGFPFHLFYHALKNSALQPMDRVIPTCAGTYRRLIGLGLQEEKLETIHWSLEEEQGYISPLNNVRNALDLPAGRQLVLWSGPLQHTGEQEFRYALEVAKQVSRKSNRFTFVFAFKPDGLHARYREAAEGNPHIRIVETNREFFSALKGETALFLSPVCNRNRTVAPPLTWIEMMRIGIPVVTTDVEGTGELIEHGHSGLIVNSIEETVASLCDLELTEQIRRNCRLVVQQKYNIDSIAIQYIRMWQQASLELGKGLFRADGIGIEGVNRR